MSYPTILLMRRLSAAGELSGPPARLMEHSRPAEELYDTQADPWEIDNLADSPEHAETLERMRTALDEWRQRVGDPGLEAESIAVPQARQERSARRDKRLRKQYEQAQPIDAVGLPAELVEGLETKDQ
jgi:hypothetical protein